MPLKYGLHGSQRDKEPSFYSHLSMFVLRSMHDQGYIRIRGKSFIDNVSLIYYLLLRLSHKSIVEDQRLPRNSSTQIASSSGTINKNEGKE